MAQSNLRRSLDNGIGQEAVNLSMPEHPFIQSNLPRDTLERVAQILELMQYLDLSKGMDAKAQLGLFRLHQMLAESVEYVSENLKDQNTGRCQSDT